MKTKLFLTLLTILFSLGGSMYGQVENTSPPNISDKEIWTGTADASWSDGTTSYYGYNKSDGAYVYRKLNNAAPEFLFKIPSISASYTSGFPDTNSNCISYYNGKLYLWAFVGDEEFSLMIGDPNTKTIDFTKRFSLDASVRFYSVRVKNGYLYASTSFLGSSYRAAIAGNWSNPIDSYQNSGKTESTIFRFDLNDLSNNPTVIKHFKSSTKDHSLVYEGVAETDLGFLLHFTKNAGSYRDSHYVHIDTNGSVLDQKDFTGPVYLYKESNRYIALFSDYDSNFSRNYVVVYDNLFNEQYRTSRLSTDKLNGLYKVSTGYVITAGFEKRLINYPEDLQQWIYMHVDNEFFPIFDNSGIIPQRANYVNPRIKNSQIFNMKSSGYTNMFFYTSVPKWTANYLNATLGDSRLPDAGSEGKIVQFKHNFVKPSSQMNFQLGANSSKIELGKKIVNGSTVTGGSHTAVLTVKNTDLSTLVGSKIPTSYLTYTAPSGWQYWDNYPEYGLGQVQRRGELYFFTLVYNDFILAPLTIHDSASIGVKGYVTVYLKNINIEADDDGDGIGNSTDNCPNISNPTQLDTDNDGIGNVCDDDDDNDGVIDTLDACPLVSGSLNGCPDTDGDGVRDSDDLCPTVPGTVNGCPDADGDGVKDSDDQCPNTQAGQSVDSNGCAENQLDDDNDGVTNDIDQCPNTGSGQTVNANGCSSTQTDTDGDGVYDSTDNCPNISNPTQLDTDNDGIGNVCDDDDDNDGIIDTLDACPLVSGSLNGCPDTDGDGVRDSDDLCPTVPGTVNGCPDADGDGVKDSDDQCPNTQAGQSVDSNGCADNQLDTDNDGYLDYQDNCPTIPGRFNGCPDTDGDSVPDDKDKCPNTPAGEIPNADGCSPSESDMDNDGVMDNMDNCVFEANPDQLDTDNDGIGDVCDWDDDNDGLNDIYDQCPLVSGSLNGCPDADGDGVRDSDDLCPTVPGTVNGCPDADGDGVKDSDDQCPNTQAGQSVDSNGCADNQLDTDNDGVTNDIDQCPTVPGSLNGCPDTDGDGVRDGLDLYPNTPAGAIVDHNGGVIFAQNNFSIQSVGLTCIDKNNGMILLTNNSSYLFDIYINNTLVMQNVLANNPFTIASNLAAGSYLLTLKSVNKLGADVSFTVKVDAAKAITAGKAEKNSISKTVSFKVQHATQYHVSVNGSLVQTYEFENEGEHTIELNLVESKNTIVIDAGCKGQVGFDVIFNEIHVYPNPTSDIATISGLYSDEVAVKVFDLRGSLVFQKNMKVHNNQIELSYAKIPVGMYIVKVQGELEETNFKIIKK